MAFVDYAFKIFSVFILAISLYIVFYREKCHEFEPTVHLHLGTKTPYRAVANLDTEPFNYSGCTPIKIWSVIRHGTRTPKTKMIKVMRDRLNYLKRRIIHSISNGEGEMCSDVLTSFKNWELNVSDNSSQILTQEGEAEMLLLGERMLLRFPQILSEDYSNSTYQFRYTATQRTGESANHFTIGLFGRQVSKQVWYPEALHADPILRFYKLCEKWKRTINKNPATYEEQNKFSRSDEMLKVINRISRRLGLKSDLNFDDALLIYQACCYETASNPLNVSPWCSVFSQEDIRIFEYSEDLKYYWKDGYGFNLNYKQACPAFNDMIKHFASKSSEPKAVFYFTHSGTLLKMLSFLSLYKDSETLRSSNYNQLLERRWKVSLIDAFGTNLMFILYKCNDGVHKILTLHQERPVIIPGCPDNNDLCPFNTVLNIFQDSISNCNFNEMCSLDNL